MNNRKGFTLLELLLVIAIIAVLAGLIVFSLRPSDSLKNANTTKNLVNSKDVEKAIQLYSMDHEGVFPPVFTPLVTGVYDLCLPNHDGCTAESIDAKILIDEGYLSEIPVVPGCQSSTSTCYKVNYNAERLTVSLENGELNPEPAFSGYDWGATAAWVQPSTTYTESYLTIAKKANGKLILVNISGNIIYESEVNDVSTLLSGNNTTSAWQDSGISTVSIRGASVFNIGNELFLSVHDSGTSAVAPANLILYKSSSGNGNGDWVLYSTVTSFAYTATKYSITDNDSQAGSIKVLSSGTWIMNGPLFTTLSGPYLLTKIAVYASNDLGLSWSYQTSFGEGINAGGAAYYSSDMSKKIVELDSGNLFAVTSKDYAGLFVNIRKSTDQGLTWTTVKSIRTDQLPVDVPFERWDDDPVIIENGLGGFYLLIGKYSTISTTGFHVYEFTDPDNDIEQVQKVKSFTNLSSTFSSGHQSVINIDGYLITTRGSYVTGVPEL